jgi:hypothetical protein
MAAQALPAIDPLRISGVHAGQRRAQPVLAGRDEDEVDMVVHQAPGETSRLVPRAGRTEQLQIGPAIVIVEEQRLLAVAALDDMVRDLGNDQPGRSRHRAPPCSNGDSPQCARRAGKATKIDELGTVPMQNDGIRVGLRAPG